MTEATIKILLPRPVNFLRTLEGSHPIPVESVPEAQLRELGKAWTEQLVAHARKRKHAAAKDRASDGD